MPFLALAIPYAQSNPISYAFDARANRHEIAIDIEKIENQSHAWQPTSQAAKRSNAHFHGAAFTCRTMPVNDYFDDVLAELITPLGACGTPRHPNNAELRKTLGDLLTLHPDGAEVSVDARISELGLPSLLRDDPAYLPGTLNALTFDVGGHSIDIGRFTFPEPDIEQEAAFLFAGESELAFLHEGNPYAARIREDHSAILAFHYRAAGMRGYTTLPPGGYALAIQDDTTLCDFTSQLARCQKQTDPSRSPRSVEDRNTRYDPLDLMQNGGCVIL
ncbi:hypothetical protein [Pandoraea sp. XY-2]|uniref:hypothetical protein n=1 Tax=Pandoraea sp. XY-2 TaxID=2518599 RepID=UPI00101B2134|nr:hypothetical protein [Pandoraea sp. XY-2]QBC32601.1 hypothetical protein DRB87_16315 [Pandoraea sp. XY-2]